MARHELTDAQFAVIAPLLPTGTRRGRPWNNHRRVGNGIVWKTKYRSSLVRYSGMLWVMENLVRPLCALATG